MNLTLKERLDLQRQAKIITESQYKQRLAEAATLSDKEQEIVDDLLNSLNEGTFDNVIEKIKSYAKKGLMTVAILSSLMASPAFSQAQKSQIKQIAQTEMTSTQTKGSDSWEQIKQKVSNTKPKIINVGSGEQSLNWGAHKSPGFKVGVSISHEKGSDMVSIHVSHVAGEDTAGFDKIVKTLKNMGVNGDYTSQTGEGFSGKISISKSNDLINFVNGVGSFLK
jgi:hypothetical protein